jgi:hypothetical protein
MVDDDTGMEICASYDAPVTRRQLSLVVQLVWRTDSSCRSKLAGPEDECLK